MKQKRILVTGAAGFIGSHILVALMKKGYKSVYAVDDLSGGFRSNICKGVNFTKLDLRNKKKTADYIASVKPEMIFHLAADATEGRSQFTPFSATERNYLAYMNVLIPAIKHGLQKMILTSSMSVYGSQKPPFSENMLRKPQDIYGIAKAAMEQATEVLSSVHDFAYVIIRPHNVYGPGQNLSDPYRNVVAIFINRLLQGKSFYIYGDGEQKRAFSYIDDFTPYMIKAAFLKKAEGQIFNIGPIQEYSLNELADVVLRQFYEGRSIPHHMKPQYVPDRPLEVKHAWCTVDKAKKMLGYQTTVSFEEGIRAMILWAKTRGPQEFAYNIELEITNKKTPKIWLQKKI